MAHTWLSLSLPECSASSVFPRWGQKSLHQSTALGFLVCSTFCPHGAIWVMLLLIPVLPKCLPFWKESGKAPKTSGYHLLLRCPGTCGAVHSGRVEKGTPRCHCSEHSCFKVGRKKQLLLNSLLVVSIHSGLVSITSAPCCGSTLGYSLPGPLLSLGMFWPAWSQEGVRVLIAGNTGRKCAWMVFPLKAANPRGSS